MTDHTSTPWQLCHHLQSAEKDASCKCGYRGGIWGGEGEVLVCEMGNCNRHEGHDMVDTGDRPTQLANAAFIVKAVNNHAALVEALKLARARIEYLGAACNDPKHFNHNAEVVLPKIDAVLAVTQD